MKHVALCTVLIGLVSTAVGFDLSFIPPDILAELESHVRNATTNLVALNGRNDPASNATVDDLEFEDGQLFNSSAMWDMEAYQEDKYNLSRVDVPSPGLGDDNGNDVMVGKRKVDGFVTTKGSQFLLNGQPYRFSGTNAWFMARMDKMSESDVDKTLREHKEKGLKVIRFWGFYDGNKYGAFQTRVGDLNERSFRFLDYVLCRGAQYGIRFIITLTDNWEHVSGAKWWAKQFGYAQKEAFFYEEEIMKAFGWYVMQMVTRKNTRCVMENGDAIYYNQDPTILAWEACNEPRFATDVVQSIQRKSDKLDWVKSRGMVINTWLQYVMGLLQKYAPYQLRATGEEGWRTNQKYYAASNPFRNNFDSGYQGSDFAANTAIPSVSYGSIHVYPDSYGIPIGDYEWLATNFLKDRAMLAAELGKPIVLGEIGCSRYYLSGGKVTRNKLLGDFMKWANEYGFGGTLHWQVVVPPYKGNIVDFEYDTDGGQAALEQYKEVA